MSDWNQIFDEFGRVVWRQALRMLGNEADVADCYQTVMLEAFELSQRQQVRSWPGLLKRLATVRSLDLLRVRYRHAADSLSDKQFREPNTDDPQETTTLENQELAEQLRRELTYLPDDQAEAFTHKWIEGMTNKEVAERMRITTNHVGVLIHRARNTLRQRLSREEV